jgi:hypothetical protein
MADFISPFKDAVVPKPTVDGDWNVKLGANIPDAPKATSDSLSGGDTASISDAPRAGSKVTSERLPGS